MDMTTTLPRVPAGRPTGGQFARAERFDSEVSLAAVHHVVAADGTVVELTPDEWTDRVVEVFMQGQCLAFAVAAAREFDLQVKVAMDRTGTVLVHAWADDSGFVVDAEHSGGFEWATEDDLIDEMYQGWGTVDIVTLDPDDAIGWYADAAAGTAAQEQAWTAAAAMIPAWRQKSGL